MNTLLNDRAFMAQFEKSKLEAKQRARQNSDLMVEGIYARMFVDLSQWVDTNQQVKQQQREQEELQLQEQALPFIIETDGTTEVCAQIEASKQAQSESQITESLLINQQQLEKPNSELLPVVVVKEEMTDCVTVIENIPSLCSPKLPKPNENSLKLENSTAPLNVVDLQNDVIRNNVAPSGNNNTSSNPLTTSNNFNTNPSTTVSPIITTTSGATFILLPPTSGQTQRKPPPPPSSLAPVTNNHNNNNFINSNIIIAKKFYGRRNQINNKTNNFRINKKNSSNIIIRNINNSSNNFKNSNIKNKSNSVNINVVNNKVNTNINTTINNISEKNETRNVINRNNNQNNTSICIANDNDAEMNCGCPECLLKEEESNNKVGHSKDSLEEDSKEDGNNVEMVDALHEQDADARLFECPNCDLRFISDSDLQAHSTLHNHDLAFKCDLCEKQFGCKRTFEKHLASRTVHKHQTKIFTCEICSKQFNRSSNYARHLASVHSVGESNCKYGCRFCERKFYYDSVRVRHETAVHHKIRPFRCIWEGCQFGSATRANVVSHVRSIHFGVPQKEQRKMVNNGGVLDFDKYVRKVIHNVAAKRQVKSKK